MALILPLFVHWLAFCSVCDVNPFLFATGVRSSKSSSGISYPSDQHVCLDAGMSVFVESSDKFRFFTVSVVLFVSHGRFARIKTDNPAKGQKQSLHFWV